MCVFAELARFFLKTKILQTCSPHRVNFSAVFCMGNKGLVNLGKLEQQVLKMAACIDFLSQLIRNVVGRVLIPMCYLRMLRNAAKPEHPAVKPASWHCRFFHGNTEVDGSSGANQCSVLQFC